MKSTRLKTDDVFNFHLQINVSNLHTRRNKKKIFKGDPEVSRSLSDKPGQSEPTAARRYQLKGTRVPTPSVFLIRHERDKKSCFEILTRCCVYSHLARCRQDRLDRSLSVLIVETFQTRVVFPQAYDSLTDSCYDHPQTSTVLCTVSDVTYFDVNPSRKQFCLPNVLTHLDLISSLSV